MKKLLMVAICASTLSVAFAEEKAASNRASNTVVLSETGVKNLRIETTETEEADFEELVFALGRLEAIPNKVSSVSSRISGRLIELNVAPGEDVTAGQDVARVESRQPGDPPPVIALKAPLGGLVTRLDTRLGDPVEPDKALLEVTDLAEVYAIAQVPEHQAGELQPGTVAHIKVAALPKESFNGELLRFGTSANKESGTVEAIFRLPNKGRKLRPGMRAEFSIVISKREGIVSVPRAALQGEPANRFVYVEDFDLPNAYVKTQVQVGEINDRFAEVVQGLLPGDKVVTQGAYSLAFAGGGSVSLKDALDAAHGHAHAEDGSELKGDGAKKANGEDGDHEHGKGEGGGLFWKIVSGVLFVLLIVSNLLKRGSQPHSATPSGAQPQAKQEVAK